MERCTATDRGTEFAAEEDIMKCRSSLTLCGAVLLALLTASCAKQDDRLAAGEQPAPTPLPKPSVTSWVTVKEDVWIPAIDALGGHLYAAEEALDSGSTSEAAAQLYGAAARLKEEGEEAVGEWQRNLGDAATDLESVAADLESGVQVPVERIDGVLDKAWETDVRYNWASRDAAEWEPLVYEPESYLALSLAQFETGEDVATAEYLRKAAAMLRMETARSTTVSDEEELVGARMDLREAAEEIELGEMHDKDRLQRVLARAAHSLARHNQLLAEHGYQIGDSEAAANSLEAATTYLERAYEWSEIPIEPATEAVFADAHAAVTERENALEAGPNTYDLQSEIAAVGSAIEGISEQLDPAWSVEHS